MICIYDLLLSIFLRHSQNEGGGDKKKSIRVL